MLAGAGFALVMISLFLSGVHHPRPEWGAYWMVRPLIVTPIAGSMGGAAYHVINSPGFTGGKRIVTAMLGILLYVFVLWLGTVFGLAGTLWH